MVIGLLEVEDLRDVRSKDLRFTPQPRDPFNVATQFVRQHLDGVLAFEVRIDRPIDLAMPPAPSAETIW